jgi:flagellar motor switch protein FliM
VEGRQSFQGALGTRRGKLAVRLVERYSEDKEEGSVVIDRPKKTVR